MSTTATAQNIQDIHGYELNNSPSAVYESNEFVNLQETKNGDLVLSLVDKQALIEALNLEEIDTDEDGHYSEIPYQANNFWDIFENIASNSELLFHSNLGYAGFGLTEAPGFTYGYLPNDDDVDGDPFTDEPHGNGRIWFYNYYMLNDFVEVLLNRGYVLFQEL